MTGAAVQAASFSHAQLKVSQLWPLERYARLTQEKQQFLLHTQLQPPNVQNTGGTWKHYHSSPESTIQMSLLEDSHLMISSGNHIYESISLWEAKKWLKGVTKGDSALFIYKINNENRRFRVKFSPTTPGGSSTSSCRHCSSVLSSFIPMHEMDTTSLAQQTMETQLSFSQPQLLADVGPKSSEPSVTLPTAEAGVAETSVRAPHVGPGRDKLLPVTEIAKMVQSERQSLGEAYRNTNFPTEQLGPFIRLCLTDANFPSFVESVEEELNTITKTL